uniref:Secreted protein n=1 Tax=Anguilla anguilla TaxID=7936 RepID=A0A0E9WZY4_ANGAN
MVGVIFIIVLLCGQSLRSMLISPEHSARVSAEPVGVVYPGMPMSGSLCRHTPQTHRPTAPQTHRPTDPQPHRPGHGCRG